MTAKKRPASAATDRGTVQSTLESIMNGQKSNIESGVSATKLMPIDITMTLHTIASDLRVMRAALAEGEAGPLVVSDVAYQLDRVQRQLDNFASEVHERGAAE